MLEVENILTLILFNHDKNKKYLNNKKDIINYHSYDVGSSKRGLQLYKML